MGGYVTRSLDFTGRTGVTTYWRAQRPLALILLLGPVISMTLLFSPLPKWTVLIGLIPILFVYIASIALGVRRLHDRNRSGWWLVIYSSPLAFSGVLFVRTGGLHGDPSSPGFIATAIAVLAGFALYVWGFYPHRLAQGPPRAEPLRSGTPI